MESAEKSGLSRRRFLGGAATTVGALAVGGPAALASKRGNGHGRDRHPFDHVVVVMMENRSFDHMLGWVHGADGRQAGLVYRDAAGVPHPTHALAPDFQGCGKADPDHSYAGGRVEFDAGRCDGWLRAGRNDDFCIGYYRQQDLSFLGQAVPRWTTFSRYFAGIMAETFPNRFYQHAGQTDRISNTSAISTLPTIWDLLADNGLTGRYYYSDVPFLALWGGKYTSISKSVTQFYSDCAAGTLPNVSFVDPQFIGESAGTSNDDHPHADIRKGEAFMAGIYKAVTTSPNFGRTALLFNYDEWGGFFEHVPPPTAPIPASDAAAGNQDGRLGFRVPCLLVSPNAKRGHVSHRRYDHTSILKMIEQRWGLPSLSVRDRSANDLGAELLPHARPRVPAIDVPQGPFAGACPPPPPAPTPVVGTARAARPERPEWAPVLEVARAEGWRV
jgi:phospholipase C